MAICPLAADWGNVADWCAVVVGVGAAIATTVVAISAHRTSKRATEIADEATKIAAQQHEETVALRQGSARILRSLLSVEMTYLPAKLAAILHTMRQADTGGPGLIADLNELKWVLSELQASLMPTAETVQERLHNFEGSIGGDVAELIGRGRSVADLCRRFQSRTVWERYETEVVVDQVGKDSFVRIRDDVKIMLRKSLEAAPFFVELVKPLPGSYDEIVEMSLLED